MNERIKELYRKAEELAHPEYEDESLRNKRLYNEIFIPILVELVIRECIDVIETAPTQHCAYTTHDKGTVDCAVGKAVAALHTHFELKTIFKA